MSTRKTPTCNFMPFSVELRKETSINSSGVILNKDRIPILGKEDYSVKRIALDGDAPKQFIKAYFYQRDGVVRKQNRKSWESFIAKTAAKWYPIESVTEYMINRIGQVMGLHMNEVRLIRANDQIRFLSKYFLSENERLIHGAEICGEHLGDMDFAKEIAVHKATSRELFTFEFIKIAIEKVYPGCCEQLLVELVRMIIFDALVGNNDRHFYNWGVIDRKKRGHIMPRFAPLYDSSRGLLWNFSDENVRKFAINGRKIVTYVEDACPRISIEGDVEINHFRLMEFLRSYSPHFSSIIDSLSSDSVLERIMKMLHYDIFPFFVSERSRMVALILKSRFEKIRRR